MYSTVSTPILTMTRDPDSSVTLRHGDPLNLTCIIQLEAAVDRDVVVTGELSGPEGITTNPTIVSNRMYQMILAIPSLSAGSLKTYNCTTIIKPPMNNTNILASKEHYRTLNISVGKYQFFL